MLVFLDESFRRNHNTGRDFGVLSGVAIPEDIFHEFQLDNRDHTTHEANARAITNFFVKSPVGRGFDSLLRIPLFAVSQGHNYGLQLADLVTTIVALRFQGQREFDPLWDLVKEMLFTAPVAGRPQTSLKVMKDTPGHPWSA